MMPTNASSFGTGQVPAQELAAARLRALETGRTVLQAAPTGYTAVANGLPQATTTHSSTSTFTWQSSAPMASYLATIDIAHFTTLRSTGPGGLPILSYAPTRSSWQ